MNTLLQKISNVLQQVFAFRSAHRAGSLSKLEIIYPEDLLDKVEALEKLLPCVPHLWTPMNLTVPKFATPEKAICIRFTAVLPTQKRLDWEGEYAEELCVVVTSTFDGFDITSMNDSEIDEELFEAVRHSLVEALSKTVAETQVS